MKTSDPGRMRTIVATVVAVLLVASGSAAAYAMLPKSEGRNPTRPLSGASGSADALPLDFFDLTPDQNLTVRKAVYRIWQRCAQYYSAPFLLAPPQPARYPKNALLLGSLEGRQVAEYGYQGPRNFVPDMHLAATGVEQIAIPQDFAPLFKGSVKTFKGHPVPKGGCSALPDRVLTDPAQAKWLADRLHRPDMPWRALQYMAEDAHDSAQKSTEVSTARKVWVRCMARAGLPYDDPLSAENDPQWSRNGNVTAHQIQVARTDLGCRMKARYSTSLRAAISQQEEHTIRQEQATLSAIRNLQLLRYQRALGILRFTPAAGTARQICEAPDRCLAW
ncbi:hypothetical protein [Actinomadura rupiterrae]|uniref:hypothetical protein n=1 Tax=Actinomadura rupiterrae TaxID=559627 RepID=UPI0020A47549|nr:hypothetical protein [Actinomadura rupiterrae]MCP2337333.1 hypothetical protein [Actinomadura rupiterrae]